MSSALLYDQDCGFCRACVGVLLSWDRDERLRPVAIQSAEGRRLLADLTPEQRLESWHLVRESPGAASPGRSRQSAGAAFPDLLRQLPGGAPLATLTRRFPHASERGYRWVVGHRGSLGRVVPARARRWADRRIENRGQAGPPAGR